MKTVFCQEQTELLRQITILDFAAAELNLFLNTHPTDKEALQMFNSCAANARIVRQAYEEQFGPLSATDSRTQSWDWINEPWPWQAEYNFSLPELSSTPHVATFAGGMPDVYSASSIPQFPQMSQLQIEAIPFASIESISETGSESISEEVF